jgi:hypothetical protein
MYQSPFPYGNPRMETGIHLFRIPSPNGIGQSPYGNGYASILISIRGLPYGNGEHPYGNGYIGFESPYGNGDHRFQMGSPNPYGDSHMEIDNTSKVTTMLPFKKWLNDINCYQSVAVAVAAETSAAVAVVMAVAMSAVVAFCCPSAVVVGNSAMASSSGEWLGESEKGCFPPNHTLFDCNSCCRQNVPEQNGDCNMILPKL